MEILIDYLTFSSSYLDSDYWIDFFNFSDVDFIAGNGRYGWNEHKYFNGIHIYSDGRDGSCVELSGVGCRCVESLNNNDFDWNKLLFSLVANESIHISRLDIACDDREQDKILSMDKLVRYSKARKYISRARRCIWIDGNEQQILFGASSSNTRLRIYNKALERKVDEHWIRAEFQLRDESAYSFILNLKQQKDIGVTYGGVLLNYLRYTTKAPDENNHNDRLETVGWWNKFVKTSERIKNIKVGGLEYNYSTLRDYIIKQTSSSLKTFIMANNGDITPLIDIISCAKINKKQEELLKIHEMKGDKNVI